MPLNLFCANEGCPKHLTKCGGAFIYSRERQAFFCKDCFQAAPPVLADCKDRWNFTTTHFTGQPIEVKGLNHLRQLEKQYGCSNHAANNMERNWSTPPPVRSIPLHPKLAEMIRDR